MHKLACASALETAPSQGSYFAMASRTSTRASHAKSHKREEQHDILSGKGHCPSLIRLAAQGKGVEYHGEIEMSDHV